MYKSWILWAAGALFLFWLVGANNRLVRLRAAALQAYTVLDAALVRQLDFVRAQLAAQDDAAATQADAVAASASTSLRAAADQLATLLASTRARPLDPLHMAVLATALQAVLAAWQRRYPDAVISFDFDGTLSRPAPLLGPGEAPPAPQTPPASAPLAWPEPSAAAEIARGQFNLAVERYNAAIAQFPSLLVAWVSRLRAAAPLL